MPQAVTNDCGMPKGFPVLHCKLLYELQDKYGLTIFQEYWHLGGRFYECSTHSIELH